MKNIFSIILAAILVATSLFVLASCSKDKNIENNDPDLIEEDNPAGLANPWTETDSHSIYEKFSFRFGIPDGAENVEYLYNDTTGLAEMQFDKDGSEWFARVSKASAFEDISGMYYEFEDMESSALSIPGTEKYSEKCEEGYASLGLWYNEEKGLMYCIGTVAAEKANLSSVASTVFEPVSGLAGSVPFLFDYSDGVVPCGADESIKTLRDWLESRFFPSSQFDDYVISEDGTVKVSIGGNWYTVDDEWKASEISIGCTVKASPSSN